MGPFWNSQIDTHVAQGPTKSARQHTIQGIGVFLEEELDRQSIRCVYSIREGTYDLELLVAIGLID